LLILRKNAYHTKGTRKDSRTRGLGKYERDDAIPSIEVAKKIADAFEVSLDYL